MLTNNTKKLIKSLHNKKNRVENALFLVEWEKSILELIKSDFEIVYLMVSKSFLEKNHLSIDYITEKEDIITSLSTITTNTKWIAVVKIKDNIFTEEKNNYTIVLDDISDPWNLWTIIRIADWYGIKNIVASKNTVDFYNPKTIISSMWSFCRINIFYTDLEDFLKDKKNIYWAFLNWENIHKTNFTKNWYIVLWSESKWISENLEKQITNKITIPSFWQAESLNVWVASGIIIDKIKSNNF